MAVARSVSDVLDERVVFEVESIDWMYLNVYQPRLLLSPAQYAQLPPRNGCWSTVSAHTTSTDLIVQGHDQPQPSTVPRRQWVPEPGRPLHAGSPRQRRAVRRGCAPAPVREGIDHGRSPRIQRNTLAGPRPPTSGKRPWNSSTPTSCASPAIMCTSRRSRWSSRCCECAAGSTDCWKATRSPPTPPTYTCSPAPCVDLLANASTDLGYHAAAAEQARAAWAYAETSATTACAPVGFQKSAHGLGLR